MGDGIIERMLARGRHTSSKINTVFVPQQKPCQVMQRLNALANSFRVIGCEATPSNLPVLSTV